MNIPETGFVLRERNFWESLDLGTLMFRRFIPVLAASFASIYVVVSFMILLWLGPVAAWLPALVVWWLKPLWERIILAPSGILFFNHDAGPRDLIRSMKRVFSTGLLLGLTIHRFSFYRTFLLPVDMFEHPDEYRRKDRRTWLHQGIDGQLFGFTAFFITLDILFFVSVLFSMNLMYSTAILGVPQEGTIFGDYRIVNLCWFAALLVTEPLSVLSAFALYINRRTIHEGWDLRLAFAKLRKRAVSKSAPVLVVTLLLLFSLFSVPHVEAAETRTDALRPASYEDKLKQVVDDREFGATEKVKVIRFKEKQERPQDDDQEEVKNPVLPYLANALRIIAIAIGGGAVVFLVVFLVRRQGVGQKNVSHRAIAPDLHLSPTDKRRVELTLAQGLEAWERADQRRALACLYQVGIALASSAHHVRLPESATESGCLAIVEHSKARADFIDLFSNITRAWVHVSWSDRPIEDGLFRRLYDGLRREDAGV